MFASAGASDGASKRRECDRAHLQAGGAAGRALWPTRARSGRRPRSQSSAPPAPPPRPRLGSCAPWGGTGMNTLWVGAASLPLDTWSQEPGTKLDSVR